jgi:hypothetical protein
MSWIEGKWEEQAHARQNSPGEQHKVDPQLYYPPLNILVFPDF